MTLRLSSSPCALPCSTSDRALSVTVLAVTVVPAAARTTALGLGVDVPQVPPAPAGGEKPEIFGRPASAKGSGLLRCDNMGHRLSYFRPLMKAGELVPQRAWGKWRGR